MTAFIDAIFYLNALGVADVILPFFLVFTVVFAVLQKSNVLGTGSQVKRYNVILSLAMGLAVVFPHILGTYPAGMNVVVIINNALPQVSVFIIAAVMLLLMLGIFGISWPGKDGNGGSLVVILSIAIITYIFIASSGAVGIPWWLTWLFNDPQMITLFVTLLVFGVVAWLITRDETDKDADKNMFFKPEWINKK